MRRFGDIRLLKRVSLKPASGVTRRTHSLEQTTYWYPGV